MKIAIQGHPIRGKEVIQILENLGGENVEGLIGAYQTFYYINDKNEIVDDHKKYIPSIYKLYTLEEFEKEFPFKIGDKVITVEYLTGTIIDFRPQDVSSYYVITDKFCAWYPADSLRFNKEMNPRNITLTLEKAKEWYNNGGELKKVALQAFTEQELNPLPKSWEEYRIKYRLPTMVFGSCIPHKYAALWKLEQLRDCYRQGWKPSPKESIYAIKYADRGLNIYSYCSQEFLSFQSEETAEEFLKNFAPLIKEAGDLI